MSDRKTECPLGDSPFFATTVGSVRNFLARLDAHRGFRVEQHERVAYLLDEPEEV